MVEAKTTSEIPKEAVDIVCPKNNNEEALVNMAIRLGYTKLIMINSTFKSDKIEIISATTNKKHRNEFPFIQTAKNNLRAQLEKDKPFLVYDIETAEPREFMHHRNSSFNQILAKIANEKDVSIGFSIKSLLTASFAQSLLIGRIKQNVSLCRKYGLPMVVASFAESPYEMRAPEEVKSIATILGLSTKEIKNSISGFLFK